MHCYVATGTYSELPKISNEMRLILDAYHLGTLYLCEQECEDPWLIFGAKTGSASKNFWETPFWPIERENLETSQSKTGNTRK
jgi:hypothetical protein